MLAGKDWSPHMIQGWTPDFIPGVLNADIIDQIVPVNQDVAKETALALARNEGIFVGVSSGATLAAALEVAASAPKGTVLLAMLPDTGERYLSTFMFDGINEGSDDDWLNAQ
jgi:cysteine synthase A